MRIPHPGDRERPGLISVFDPFSRPVSVRQTNLSLFPLLHSRVHREPTAFVAALAHSAVPCRCAVPRFQTPRVPCDHLSRYMLSKASLRRPDAASYRSGNRRDTRYSTGCHRWPRKGSPVACPRVGELAQSRPSAGRDRTAWLNTLNPLESTPRSVAERVAYLTAAGFEAMDAYHLAWAEHLRADMLVTTDDGFLSQCSRCGGMIKVRVLNPVTVAVEMVA